MPPVRRSTRRLPPPSCRRACCRSAFTALLVNTGAKLMLIDTGTAGQITDTAGVMLDNLKVAGVAPADIDTILISHFHPDHIDGIKTKDGAKVFPNAEILVPEPEWAFWMDDANMGRYSATASVHKYFLNARRIFSDIAERGAPLQARRRSRARHRVDPRLRPHARPHRLRHPFRQPIDAGDERHRARALAVRAPSAMAAELRHGRAAGGEGAHRTCSTARPPTACWSRPITSPSRPAATSSRAASGYDLAPVDVGAALSKRKGRRRRRP